MQGEICRVVRRPAGPNAIPNHRGGFNVERCSTEQALSLGLSFYSLLDRRQLSKRVSSLVYLFIMQVAVSDDGRYLGSFFVINRKNRRWNAELSNPPRFRSFVIIKVVKNCSFKFAEKTESTFDLSLVCRYTLTEKVTWNRLKGGIRGIGERSR